MTILRKYEAAIIVALGLTCVTAYSFARIPTAKPAVTSTKMIKVVVVGKRLTAAQKAQQR